MSDSSVHDPKLASGAAERYRQLLVELRQRRQLAGGVLAPEDESRLVGALDRCWHEMSDEEQLLLGVAP